MLHRDSGDVRRSEAEARVTRFGDRSKLYTGRGPNGRRLCGICGTEVPPGRRAWCSESCVHEWNLRSSGSYMRHHVKQRDAGICAICGLDCPKLDRILRRASESLRTMPLVCPDGAHRYAFRFHVRQEMYRSLGFVPDRAFWEVDHVVPVVRGGGSCGLDNLRTLCVPCHRNETRALAAERARERKDESRLLLEGE